MMRLGFVCFALLFPLAGFSCESVNREQCKERFVQLVTYRTEAIITAFGDLVGTLPEELDVRFAGSKELADSDGKETYDAEHRTLVFPRRLLSAKLPNPMRAAAYYWPFYENEQYRSAFPASSFRMAGSPIASFQPSTLSTECGQSHTGCGKSEAYIRQPSPRNTKVR